MRAQQQAVAAAMEEVSKEKEALAAQEQVLRGRHTRVKAMEDVMAAREETVRMHKADMQVCVAGGVAWYCHTP